MSLQELINEVRGMMESVEPEGDEVDEKTIKRHVAGGMGMKTVKLCPPGKHRVGGKCVKVSPAALKKMAKAKARWRKSAAGKRSAKKSAKLRRRRGT